MNLFDTVTLEFRNKFGFPATLVARAPGRVNLIGEHTDYNNGFVLPIAIDLEVMIALRPNKKNTIRIYSMDYQQTAMIKLDLLQTSLGGWASYIQGVAWALREAGYIPQGWDGIIAGNIPVGAGLSSSAALELAAARAFCGIAGYSWDPLCMAMLAQRAENEYVGVNCGIMDQLICAAGEAGQALLIDCQSMAISTVPLPNQIAVAVMDTGSRRGLVNSAYNERRKQCDKAAKRMGITTLRDISLEEFTIRSRNLDEVLFRRAKHVISENQRTLQAVIAMREGNIAWLGSLLNFSHNSLREDFEVSSFELDLIVETARDHPGCLGARMTGAGFGGCALALVHPNQQESFAYEVIDRYFKVTRTKPHIYFCVPSSGASIQFI